MFTGIVSSGARIHSIEKLGSSAEFGARMVVDFAGAEAALESSLFGLGQSVALNGVCLTIVKREGARLSFDLSHETLDRTTFRLAAASDPLNFEPSLVLGAPLGGHQVSGHVDAVGEVLSYESLGESHHLKVFVPQEIFGFMFEKGSVAIDGVSLTINAVDKAESAIHLNIIPHTHEITLCRFYAPSRKVNLEADGIAKYVVQAVRALGVRA